MLRTHRAARNVSTPKIDSRGTDTLYNLPSTEAKLHHLTLHCLHATAATITVSISVFSIFDEARQPQDPTFIAHVHVITATGSGLKSQTRNKYSRRKERGRGWKTDAPWRFDDVPHTCQSRVDGIVLLGPQPLKILPGA
jgi:hypothetical protein